jgi:hypothetical protein
MLVKAQDDYNSRNSMLFKASFMRKELKENCSEKSCAADCGKITIIHLTFWPDIRKFFRSGRL